ncbi:collagen alpha-2(VI) chain-like [Ruditapes philippinarum]|uniref:collagen alpha-2(VI) chain-like n=1 Tax=Ruditapes philippinarum TaxID=129788 RepID=UPI00295B498C|nr:collagen alpha-2(VI) chain-like [Ruditapes philippinarum]
MKQMDRDELIERELDNRICLHILAIIAIVFSSVFVIITTLAVLNIRDIDANDAEVRLQIERLQEKLRTFKLKQQQLADSAGDMINEMAQLVENGAVTRMEQPSDKNDESEKTSNTEKDRNRSKRQNIDIFGAILEAQRVVFERHCVSHDTPCPKGHQGDKGINGDTGVNGVDGTNGVNGTDGLQGDAGLIGPPGENGTQGLQGDKGMYGTNGIIGDTGVWGENGIPGTNGSAGPQGGKGEPGGKGLIGDTGFWGGNGTQGVNGTKGAPGEPGLQGINGTIGDIGPRGQDVRKFADGCQCFKKPTFLNPNDQTITVSTTGHVVIPCSGEGNPTPTVTLNMLPKKGRKRAINKSGNAFTLDNPVDTDYGRYVCTATNQYGSASKIVTVSKP